MEPKTIISIALAVFILGGLVFLHIRASKRKKDPGAAGRPPLSD